MDSPVKPTVVVSKCIEFDACRYNGLMISSDVVKALMPLVDFVPVCAEIEIGLGLPRDPIRVASGANGLRLLQPSTGADVTDAMVRFAASFLESLPVVDGFVLKSRSPSCGIKDVKIFRGVEKEAAVGKGAGFFGAAVLEKFPGHPVEDEGRLMNFRIREHFLTSLYALTRFRATRGRLAMRDLVDFQARNKLLLMSYNQKEMRILGKIVANLEKKRRERSSTSTRRTFARRSRNRRNTHRTSMCSCTPWGISRKDSRARRRINFSPPSKGTAQGRFP